MLQVAAAGGLSMAWFENPDRIETTRALMVWDYIAKVDLHKPDTGAEPKYYRATDRGKALWKRSATWELAKSITLPET